MARLLSVNVGLPRDIDWKGRTVRTGIWKEPVHERCWAGRLNLAGDGQGEHGAAGRRHLEARLDETAPLLAVHSEFPSIQLRFGGMGTAIAANSLN